MMAIPTGQVEAVRLLLSYPCVANSDHLHLSRNDATTAFFWYVSREGREGGREEGLLVGRVPVCFLLLLLYSHSFPPTLPPSLPSSTLGPAKTNS